MFQNLEPLACSRIQCVENLHEATDYDSIRSATALHQNTAASKVVLQLNAYWQ